MNAGLAVLQVLMLLLNLALLAVAVVALLRTAGLRQLQARIEHLDPELHRPRRERARAAADEEEALEVIPVEETRPEVTPTPQRKRPDTPPPAREAGQLEGVIGRQVLGWAAVVLLLFAVGF